MSAQKSAAKKTRRTSTKKKTVSASRRKRTGEKELADFRGLFQTVKTEVQKEIVGQDRVLEDIITAAFVGGHILLEGVPGLGKTLMVKTLARSLDLHFNRIQFTPDMIPADITGTMIVSVDDRGRKSFDFRQGPVFCNLLLADEINRATPKTQSALLEAMAEGHVSAAGETRLLEQPFCVLATQNPIEMEGTYPLPEAQLDRFLFKINVPFPSADELGRIVGQTTGNDERSVRPHCSGKDLLRYRHALRDVPAAEDMLTFASTLVLQTHPDRSETAAKYFRFGASPRAAQGLILAAKVYAVLNERTYVAKEDIVRAALPILRHRVLLNFESEADGVSPDTVIEKVIAHCLDSISAKSAKSAK